MLQIYNFLQITLTLRCTSTISYSVTCSHIHRLGKVAVAYRSINANSMKSHLECVCVCVSMCVLEVCEGEGLCVCVCVCVCVCGWVCGEGGRETFVLISYHTICIGEQFVQQWLLHTLATAVAIHVQQTYI